MPPARTLAAFALCLLALTAAGCGGGGSGDGGGSISADGSSTVGPYMTAAAEDFQKENAAVRITVGVSGTGGGFERFCRGETDISDASRAYEAAGVDAMFFTGLTTREQLQAVSSAIKIPISGP